MSGKSVDKGRRRFLVGLTSVMGAAGAAAAAVPFAASWMPSARTKAAGAPVEVDVSKLNPGGRITVEWRGKPVWIIRRNGQHLGSLDKLNDQLRDPDSEVAQQPDYAKNTHRSINPEYLILIGICTHLGCAPVYEPDIGSVDNEWPGGFYCPCHGSKFDFAGRVYKGVPAPVNMEVPPHRFEGNTVVVIGEEAKKA